MVLHNAMSEIKPLLMDNFPDHWGELYAMSIVRVNGYTPLKRIKDNWEDLYDPEGLKKLESFQSFKGVTGRRPG